MTTDKLRERLAEVRTAQTKRHEPEQPPTEPETRQRVPRRRAKGPRWDERNRRATFYLGNDLLDDLEEFSARTGRSKSEVVAYALDRYINDPNPTTPIRDH